MLQLLKLLNKQNIKTAILTNGVLEAQQNKVNCLNIEKQVDLVHYARINGKKYEKPHSQSFEHILKRFSASKTR